MTEAAKTFLSANVIMVCDRCPNLRRLNSNPEAVDTCPLFDFVGGVEQSSSLDQERVRAMKAGLRPETISKGILGRQLDFSCPNDPDPKTSAGYVHELPGS